MREWTVRIVAAGILGIALLTLGPGREGVTAAEPVPAEAVATADLQFCIQHAAAEFQRCRRHGHTVAVCTAWAAERFNICRGGGDAPKPCVAC